MKAALLGAAVAHRIPEGESGRWYVRKYSLARDLRLVRGDNHPVRIPAGHYTQLLCWTMQTLHSIGELVMQDTPDELNTHLEFMMKAFGKVLVTGLGLGCVARGCAIKSNVESVTVIERDANVLKLVRPYITHPKIEIVEADARDWADSTDTKFHCAWHDLWNDDERGDPHLQVMHAELVGALAERVVYQNAWAMPRHWRRAFGMRGRSL